MIFKRKLTGQRAVRRAAHCVAEALEKRCLLTTLSGGGVDATTGEPLAGNPFEYVDSQGNIVRITLKGSIVAEFIGIRIGSEFLNTSGPALPVTGTPIPITGANNAAPNIVDLVTFNDAFPINPDTGQRDTQIRRGTDLFAIYISNSDSTGSIAIATVPQVTELARPMQPFSGGAQVRAIDATTGIEQLITPNAAGGGVFLGGRTIRVTNNPPPLGPNAGNTPILSVPFSGVFGVRPNLGTVFAGIQGAAGQNVGRIMVGGYLTGRVNIAGSVDTIYAGALLTGDARGLRNLTSPTVSNNFSIGGDLNHLITLGSIGSDLQVGDQGIDELEQLNYKTGVQIRVGGKLGNVYSKDAIIAGFTINNNPAFQGPGVAQTEFEVRAPEIPATSSASFFEGNWGPNFSLALGAFSATDNPVFYNDTPQTAQYLANVFSNAIGGRAIQVRGALFSSNSPDGVFDNVDYYATPLVAGQEIQVQLLTGVPQLRVGVFDVDGRLIATNYSNVQQGVVQTVPFRFVPERDGVYRFAIGLDGDYNFNGSVDEGESNFATGEVNTYELRITRFLGDIGVGGIVADGSIGFMDQLGNGPATSVTVNNGDLGALVINQDLNNASIFGFALPITVSNGSIRVIDAPSVGAYDSANNFLRGWLNLNVSGDVGLVRSFGAGANKVLSLNLDFADRVTGVFDPANAIGGTYRTLQASGAFISHLLANKGVGTIRATSVGINGQPAVRWAVNADNQGSDGRIDLIEILGNFGTLSEGGPQITTGDGGNIRYIRATGTVFRDLFFGGGAPEPTLYNPGQRVDLVDDSGTAFRMTPDPIVFASPIDTVPFAPGRLSVLTYGVRDKGGVVVLNVDVLPGTGNGVPVGRGFKIETSAVGSNASVEISNLRLFNNGTALEFDPTTGIFTPAINGQTNSVNAFGKVPIDFFNIQSLNFTGTAPSGMVGYNNRTPGELLNLTASDIQLIEGEYIGVTRLPATSGFVGGSVRNNELPFNQQRTLIQVLTGGGQGEIQTIRARGAVGNVLAANIGSVTANSDKVNDPSRFEGITGPIVARKTNPGEAAEGNILSVNIGEGLPSSGTGSFALTGIFADRRVASIVNTGSGSDIRGTIYAGAQDLFPFETAIGSISLNNGAIINANIIVPGSIDLLLESISGFRANNNTIALAPTSPGGTFNNPTFNIGSITLNGKGGIIGSFIAASSIGTIRVTGGFGVFSSRIIFRGDSTFDGIIAGGFGIRDTTITGGSNLRQLRATENGRRILSTVFVNGVRASENNTFDKFTGLAPSKLTDIHRFLGTSANTPRVIGVSESGVIEDVNVSIGRDLGVVNAWRIQARNAGATPNDSILYPMRFAAANSINTIETIDRINGLGLFTGRVTLFKAGTDVFKTGFNVAGKVQSIVAGGRLAFSSQFRITGPDGSVDNINVAKNLESPFTINVNLGTMVVGGNFFSRSFRVLNNVTTFHVKGNIKTEAQIRIGNNTNLFKLGGDLEAGATFRTKSLNTQQVDGQIIGDFIVG